MQSIQSLFSNPVPFYKANLIDSNYKKILTYLLDTFNKNKIIFEFVLENIKHREKYTDILYVLKYVKDIEKLKELKYQEIEYENFHYSVPNCVLKYERIEKIKPDEFVYTIFGKELVYKENNIYLIDRKMRNREMFIFKDLKIIDLVQNKFGDIFLHYFSNKKFYIMKTHITNKFLKQSGEILESELEYQYKIEVNSNFGYFIKCEGNYLYMSNKTKIHKIILGKRYYFINQDKIFFNKSNLDFELGFIEQQEIQVEHLYLYDLISIVGLNDFEINNRKISTYELEHFLNLFKLPFSGTLNGSLNYFDFCKEKDYKILIENEDIKINGNFNYDYLPGEYIIEIIIKENGLNLYEEISVIIKAKKNGVLIKEMDVYTINRHLYFLGLDIFFSKIQYFSKTIFIEINTQDKYSCKTKNIITELENEIIANTKNLKYRNHNNQILKTYDYQKMYVECTNNSEIITLDYLESGE